MMLLISGKAKQAFENQNSSPPQIGTTGNLRMAHMRQKPAVPSPLTNGGPPELGRRAGRFLAGAGPCRRMASP